MSPIITAFLLCSQSAGDDKFITSVVGSDNVDLVRENSTVKLNLKSVAVDDGGKYDVTATNSYGEDKIEIMASVLG